MSRPHGVLYSTEIDPPAAPWVTPIVRALAAEAGVDLSTVTGTGVGGRIRPGDLPRPAETAEKAAPEVSDAAAAARSVFAVEADVTASGTGLAALLKAVVDVAELGNLPIAGRVGGRLVYLPGVRDLNLDGITKLLANPASAKVDPERTLLVLEEPHALLAAPAIPGWTGPILTLGAALRRPAVVPTKDGGEGLAIRTIAQLTLTTDPLTVDDATATAFLSGVASRL